MIRIAICDDNINVCVNLKNLLNQYEKEKHKELTINIFHSGEELLSQLSNFDLIFLDIQLLKMNGIEVGIYLRENLKNNITQIVYISTEQKFALELFQNRPFDFLVKPLNPIKIFGCLDKYCEIYEDKGIFFDFSYNGVTSKINVCDIIFFESMKRKIYITTVYEKFEFYGKINCLQSDENLKEYMIRLHVSFLINKSHIIKCDKNSVTMSNNIVIPITRTYKNNYKEFLLSRL
jgi:DNA-binding LytR/AlgR family response regulator